MYKYNILTYNVDSEEAFIKRIKEIVGNDRLVSVTRIKDGKLLILTEDKIMEKYMGVDLGDSVSKIVGEMDLEDIE